MLSAIVFSSCSTIANIPSIISNTRLEKQAQQKVDNDISMINAANSLSELSALNDSDIAFYTYVRQSAKDWESDNTTVLDVFLNKCLSVLKETLSKVKSINDLTDAYDAYDSCVDRYESHYYLSKEGFELIDKKACQILADCSLENVDSWTSAIKASLDTDYTWGKKSVFNIKPFILSIFKYEQELLSSIEVDKFKEGFSEDYCRFRDIQLILNGLLQFRKWDELHDADVVNSFISFVQKYRKTIQSSTRTLLGRCVDIKEVSEWLDTIANYNYHDGGFNGPAPDYWAVTESSIKHITNIWNYNAGTLFDSFYYCELEEKSGIFNSYKELADSTNIDLNTDCFKTLVNSFIASEKEHISQVFYTDEWIVYNTIITGVQNLGNMASHYYQLCKDYLNTYNKSVEAYNDIHYDAVKQCHDNLEKIVKWISSESFNLVFFNIPDNIQSMPLYYGHKQAPYKSAETTLKRFLSARDYSAWTIDLDSNWWGGYTLTMKRYGTEKFELKVIDNCLVITECNGNTDYSYIKERFDSIEDASYDNMDNWNFLMDLVFLNELL